jgi:EAL and modified HD-GYP domain-containing signal transduction protein
MMPAFFFARQPILDGARSVFGYELLFRNGLHNVCRLTDGEHATLEILSNAFFNSSFHQMVGGKRGLVNCTRELLLSDVVLLFSPEELVIEVLEDVAPDEKIVGACRRMKASGWATGSFRDTFSASR